MPTQKPTPQPPLLLTALAISGALCVLFTGVHMVVYNWVFLPQYAQAKGLPWFLTLDLLVSYWRWWPGRILVLVNVGLLLGHILLFVWLKRLAERDEREEESRGET